MEFQPEIPADQTRNFGIPAAHPKHTRSLGKKNIFVTS
jgi:hypothetical protein